MSGCDLAPVWRIAILIAVLGSGLWHLILLLPALAAKSEFVRWHGRQALLLAGLRTVVPLLCVLVFGPGGACLFILALIPIWIGGTLWGQRQATRGDCSLMRRFGRAEALPAPEPAVVPDEAKEFDADALVDIIRYSQDPEERRRALSQLEKLGMVESLGDASAATAIPTTGVATPDVAPAPAASRTSTGRVATPDVVSAPRRLPFVLLPVVGGVILVIVAVVLSAVLIRTPSRDASAYVVEAKAHYQRGEYEEAIADYTEALRLDPDNPLFCSYRGEAYSKLGEYERAVADYTEALRLEPNESWVYVFRGHDYYELGEFERAIADYTEALRFGPNDAWLYYLRGKAYHELGEYEQAIADYTEAIRLDPESAAACNNLAWTMAYDLDTNYEEALEYALRAVELQPVASNHHTLALVYYKLERYDEALDHYSLALSLDSAHASSYRGRGDVYLALGDYQAALDDYQRYLDLEPEASDRQAVEQTIEWLQRQGE